MAEEIGHNSGVTGAKLKSYIERVERLNEEKKALAEDIKDVWSEAKAQGFDVPTMKEIVKRRRMDADRRREKEELLALYLSAMGLI